jgi:L-fuculose-phosphate aldolase
MSQKKLRKEIISTVRKFNSTALSMGTSGNLSVRAKKGFLITPSGMPYDEMQESDLLLLDIDGELVGQKGTPSSEWRIHRDIYRNRPEINAVVHVHSQYATAISCTRQDIPAFHYEVALAGDNSIRCAAYATFGSQELSDNAMAALKDRSACLLANHGQLALGSSLKAAFKFAQVVEVLAKQYTLSITLGGPVLLGDDEMELNVKKFKHYTKKAD